MVELPEEFLVRMRSDLGTEFDKFLKSYALPAEKGIRVNTLKIDKELFKQLFPFSLEQTPWEENGFYVKSESPGKTIYHAAGLYYVQEPSAMSVAPNLGVKRGDRVLDLCSAPGGKGTQLAQYLCGEGIIFLNEINFQRAKILSSNVERLGIKNSVVTCASPEVLAKYFDNYFDKILVDAPCSGEGMFKKESEAIPEWSLDNVDKCAVRQAEILESAYRMLAGGGRLVYSTCTFAPKEDEIQMDNFLARHNDCKFIVMNKLLPHKIRGEGHFYAVIEKSVGVRNEKSLHLPMVKDKKMLALYREWEQQNLSLKFENIHAVGQTLYSLPFEMPYTVNIQTLRAGVRLGDVTGNRFEPSHSLAMSLSASQANTLEVDEKTALNYLKGLTFDCTEDIKGWRLVIYKGYPLGWTKIANGVAKNRLPKGIRI